MQINKNPYYDQFRCIASACPDSCCKDWSVAVDSVSAAYYRTLPGLLGDRLRQVLTEEDSGTVMTIENGRCPMWCEDGLCRIQSELGHHALCKTCRDFPRLTHDYGSFQEWTLELSCPETARLILNSPAAESVTVTIPGGEEAEYDPEIMGILLRTRQEIYAILHSGGHSIAQTLAICLLYGYHAQAQLDGDEAFPFDPNAALVEAMAFAKPGDTGAVLDFFGNLEILTPQWKSRLLSPCPVPWEFRHLRLMDYFLERYWLQAVADYDLVGRVKLAIISCLLIKLLGGELIQTAQLYSKEIENDPDNIDAILDGAYTCPAFTDEKLLGLLLRSEAV